MDEKNNLKIPSVKPDETCVTAYETGIQRSGNRTNIFDHGAQRTKEDQRALRENLQDVEGRSAQSPDHDDALLSAVRTGGTGRDERGGNLAASGPPQWPSESLNCPLIVWGRLDASFPLPTGEQPIAPSSSSPVSTLRPRAFVYAFLFCLAVIGWMVFA